ncbi:calcium-binding protein [Mesorhizobium sp. LHD-90]|uniref:calcium-binding protein n=1 Tax=Mesorhizobium sp. LHD-90 TaxID=3071414 RepID=UPI0027DF45AD|nr:calcium-binding protein [Mesorhizobium sp. LHD-90]MDQ6436865.1 calcium-binding protein [Mesorhizobium sp. LHD-90]
MGFQRDGSEFLVNTTTNWDQYNSSVTALNDERFVVTWTDYSKIDTDIRGQIFNTDGSKAGGEFLVNTTIAGDQYGSSVTALSDGRFVVAWTDESQTGNDTSNTAVRAQFYNANGSKAGAELLVNTTTMGEQRDLSVAALTNNRVVFTWTDRSDMDDNINIFDIRGQIFGADGLKKGGEFPVNTIIEGQQTGSHVAALADGRFIVTWFDLSLGGGDGSDSAVRAQLFNANGSKAGGTFLVNTTTNNFQGGPSAIGLTDGRFVVTWTDESKTGGDLSSEAIRGQVFNANGSKAGGEFLVNSTTERAQNSSSTTALKDGRFVVTWTEESQFDRDPYFAVVRAQVFAADGSKSGREFIAGTTTKGQQSSSVAALTDGRFIISWTDLNGTGGDSNGRAVHAQIFDATRYIGDATAENVTGGAFADTFTGLGGNDALGGAAGNDKLFGGDGIDLLIGGLGADYLSGGTGRDTASYAQAVVAVRVNLADASLNAGEAKGDTFNSIENLEGSAFNDTLEGNASANHIEGGAGTDTLSGLAGDDRLSGGDGNDTLRGGLGADYISGGAGTDTASYKLATAGVAVSLADPSLNAGEAKGDTFSSIENLFGSDFNDTLAGNGASNAIQGGLGNDTIRGLGGNDKLTGNSGKDIFVFDTALNAAGNVDAIADFKAVDDTVNLENAVFKALTATGALAATAFSANTTGLAGDADDRIVYETDTGKLFYDADGNGAGAAIHFATLTGLPAIAAGDFQVV